MRNVLDVLQERGFIEDVTDKEELLKLLSTPKKVYCGFDPSAESLHLGNMVAMMGLAWFQRFGHTPFALVGGATGMIGDPSGKSTERQLLDQTLIERNVLGIKKNLEAFLKFDGDASAQLINNYDWFKDLSFVDFLRDVGKYFRVGPMLAKDSVRSRMTSEEGMSFTEFSYQLLQGYDFLHLYQHHDVCIQLGGSDQWGNITAGTDLIRKAIGKPAYGITFALLTKSDGQKFGKSEKGAIWLSEDKLSPYEFYQHLFRVADADVIKLMRMLTFMEMDEIRHYEEAMQKPDYHPNTAQRRLADEVTKIVHGAEKLQVAQEVTKAATPGSKTVLDASTLEKISQDMPSQQLAREQVVEAKLIDLLVLIGLQSSKGEARRLLKNGGVYLNNEKISDENYSISAETLIEDCLLLVSAGKKNKMLIKIK